MILRRGVKSLTAKDNGSINANYSTQELYLIAIKSTQRILLC